MSGKLTKTQCDLLSALLPGEHITYSQDGEVGWLWPSNVRLERFGISDRELHQLRKQALIGPDPDFDEETAGRFSAPDVITEAGRLALSNQKGDTNGR